MALWQEQDKSKQPPPHTHFWPEALTTVVSSVISPCTSCSDSHPTTEVSQRWHQGKDIEHDQGHEIAQSSSYLKLYPEETDFVCLLSRRLK
jgi:hypothetical protein